MEKIVEFLRKNVNGKTLYTDEIIYYLEDKKLQETYSDQVSFSNMFFSKVRFTLDMFVVSRERTTEARTGYVIRDVYSSSLYRYSLATRRSTGNATGARVLIASSLMSEPIPTESVVFGIYDMRLKGEELSWIDEQMLYRDQLCADGTYRPAAFKSKCRLLLDKGKLVYEREEECFDVDSSTMERTQSDSKYPIFVSKERRM
jgi:hypothetical protein